MNAKLCKRLRRQAEAATVGQPARRIIGKKVFVKRANSLVPCVAINDPRSTRGAYRALKRLQVRS